MNYTTEQITEAQRVGRAIHSGETLDVSVESLREACAILFWLDDTYEPEEYDDGYQRDEDDYDCPTPVVSQKNVGLDRYFSQDEKRSRIEGRVAFIKKESLPEDLCFNFQTTVVIPRP